MSEQSKATAPANKRLLKKLFTIAILMFGFGFALVPFYNKICEATGIKVLLRPDTVPLNTQVDKSRTISVEFDANTRGLGWVFEPKQRAIDVHPGELVTAMYEVRNTRDRAVTGQAIASFGPMVAGLHFKKLECFCFKQQTLQAGEVREMPVVFVVDAGLPENVATITLSYTFFEVPEDKQG